MDELRKICIQDEFDDDGKTTGTRYVTRPPTFDWLAYGPEETPDIPNGEIVRYTSDYVHVRAIPADRFVPYHIEYGPFGQEFRTTPYQVERLPDGKDLFSVLYRWGDV